MKTMAVTLKTVTPLFLGGAEFARGEDWKSRDGRNRGPTLHVLAELRPPSVKGALRYWYRALVGLYESGQSIGDEQGIFGSMETGQSPVSLRVIGRPKVNLWNKQLYQKYRVPQSQPPKNGILYLGFSLDARSDEIVDGGRLKAQKIRQQIDPGETITVILRAKEEMWLEVYWSALWVLCTFGGLGFRSRRGFGSLTIEKTDSVPFKLPLSMEFNGATALCSEILGGMQSIYDRLGLKVPANDGQYTHFYRGQAIRICGKNWADGDAVPWNNWEEALAAIGVRLSEARTGTKPLINRKAFGIPVSSTVMAKERHASPLWLRVVRLKNNRYCVLATHFPSSRLAVEGDPVNKFLQDLPNSVEGII